MLFGGSASRASLLFLSHLARVKGLFWMRCTIDCLVFSAFTYLCSFLIPILGHTGQRESPGDLSLCCSLNPKVPSLLVFCCLTLCVFLTIILCVISRLFSCAWQKEWNKCVYSSSWSQKVSLVGYIVRRQLAGFTDGLDVGCDREDTEW